MNKKIVEAIKNTMTTQEDISAAINQPMTLQGLITIDPNWQYFKDNPDLRKPLRTAEEQLYTLTTGNEWWLQAELMDSKEFGVWAKTLSDTQINNYYSNADQVSAAADHINK